MFAMTHYQTLLANVVIAQDALYARFDPKAPPSTEAEIDSLMDRLEEQKAALAAFEGGSK